MRVWARMEARGETGRASALIRTVVKRIKIDLWRRREMMARRNEVGRCEPTPARPIDDAELDQLKRRLRVALNTLPEVQRDVVRMRMVEGRTFVEIAQRQGVPLNTALGRMHLALKALRQELIDEDESLH